MPWPRNERGALAGLKTTSYAENVIALARAAEHGATEAIFPNTAGNLCEGTGTNVFYVVDGELRTPTLDAGCLAGVTRALILEWFGGREVDEPVEVLERASEIFLASTTRDVQGVHTCDGRSYPRRGRSPRRRPRCGRAWSASTRTRKNLWTQTTPVLGGTGVDVVVRSVSDGEQLTDQLVDVELGAFGALGDQGDRLVDERGDLLSGCLHEELPIG